MQSSDALLAPSLLVFAHVVAAGSLHTFAPLLKQDFDFLGRQKPLHSRHDTGQRPSPGPGADAP
ncbi:hypothetical protein RHECNPAF_850038 [Rhizobium etli CNPAF512]|nr:hypothetical protein RHECNPAF_850038 [Rhizobium etli CNPAF512]